MSMGVQYLHSHSSLERELKFPKNYVLIDAKFKDLFANGAINIEPFPYKGTVYYKVPVMAFVRKNGVFKNLDA